MGKDNHTKQSKGSNNSKVQPFLGQDNKPNNVLLHNSVLQWVPEPRLFIHQDVVCMILIILSEMLLFLQYFMLFGTSFLNYNWRQFIVSAILLLLEQVNEIIPKVANLLIIIFFCFVSDPVFVRNTFPIMK
jgi:hypothetical protein